MMPLTRLFTFVDTNQWFNFETWYSEITDEHAIKNLCF